MQLSSVFGNATQVRYAPMTHVFDGAEPNRHHHHRFPAYLNLLSI